MSSPAFQFYPKDFMLATQAWSVDEVGIYIKLLCSQWDNNGLPNDLKRLARIVGLDYDDFKKAWVIVGLKFSVGEDGVLRNSRLELTRDEQEAFKEKQRSNGLKGGRPKIENPNETQTKPKQKANLKPKITSSYSTPSIISTKVEYAPDVLLLPEEHERLVKEFGLTFINDCIKHLSDYFEEKPSKKKDSKNHNLTIRRWVVDAVKEKQNKQRKLGISTTPYTMAIQTPMTDEEYEEYVRPKAKA